MSVLSRDDFLPLVRLALAEDVGAGDVTSQAVVGETRKARARVVARENLVVAGLSVAAAVFAEVDASVDCQPSVFDGQAVERGAVVMEVAGSARGILTAERVALNFLQRLSGIATLTARYVRAVEGTQAGILDTRKTTPGWRVLEKYAVRCGGGINHRAGLHDMILIKDNHLAALEGEGPNLVAVAVHRARAAHPTLRVEVEADTLEQVAQAVEAGADVILLDNMTPDHLRTAVALVEGRCQTEASGGISLESVRGVAVTGVNWISVGALTHSAQAVDLALDFQMLSGPPGKEP